MANEQPTALDGSALPTRPLPVPPQKAMNDILASMTDMTAMHVPALIGIYGDQGTGKTVTGMKFLQAIVPKEKFILYIDSAANWVSLQNHPELMKRVKFMEYENMEQLQAVATMLRTSAQLREKIGGVMVDEYSVMSNRDQAWIVRTRSEQAAKEIPAKFKDPFQPTLPDYLGQKIRSGETVNMFLVSKTHIVFISHEKKEAPTFVTMPDFPDKAGKEFQRLIHGVYHATVEVAEGKEDVYKLQLKPFNKISAKNRIGGLGSYATIEQVVKAYKNWGITSAPEADIIEEPSLLEDDEETKLLALLNKDN